MERKEDEWIVDGGSDHSWVKKESVAITCKYVSLKTNY